MEFFWVRHITELITPFNDYPLPMNLQVAHEDDFLESSRPRSRDAEAQDLEATESTPKTWEKGSVDGDFSATRLQ